MPTLSAPKALVKCIRIKLASVNLLSGVRTNKGLPSDNLVMFSPE